jgi:hypothetical protein
MFVNNFSDRTEAFNLSIAAIHHCLIWSYIYIKIFNAYIVSNIGWTVVAMIVLQLDLQLPMQSVPITTDVVISNLDQGEVYNIM